MPKNAHTLQLAAEREAMEASGLTRSQAREALLKASKLNEATRVKEEFKEEQLFKRLQAKLAPPQLPVVEQKFEPGVFGLGGVVGAAPQPVAQPNRDLLKLVSATITLDGSEVVPDGGIFKTFSVAIDVPNGTPLMVDTGGQIWPITFVGSYTTGGMAYLHFWSEYGSTNFTAGTITITAVLLQN